MSEILFRYSLSFRTQIALRDVGHRIVAYPSPAACDGRPAHNQGPYRNTYCPVKSSHNKCLI